MILLAQVRVLGSWRTSGENRREHRRGHLCGSWDAPAKKPKIEGGSITGLVSRGPKPLLGVAVAVLALVSGTTGCGGSGDAGNGTGTSGEDAPRLADARLDGAREDSEATDTLGDASGATGVGSSRHSGHSDGGSPNIVLVSVDDLDLETAQALPLLQDTMSDEGTTFENAFVTNPICCPSRATTLRGQYAQNTLVQGNQPPQGGYEKFHRLGRERSTFATWLDSAGYQTAYMGKYMNGYQGNEVPPGWDEWLAVSGNYESDDLTYNGRLLPGALKGRHETDVLSRKSSLYIERASQSQRPFLLYVAPRAPHPPAEPAPRHEDRFSGEDVPADPSEDPAHNESNLSDKPQWLKGRQPITREEQRTMVGLHRDRLRSMQSVEEMMVRLEDKLRETGELGNTYMVFTSDNGFHMGQHRLPTGKWTAYEEDIRVPLMVRGPGVPEGESREHMVLNNDLAPTFADLAAAGTPPFVDGASLAPLLDSVPPKQAEWRQAFLVEAGRFFPGAGAGPPIDRPRLDAVRTVDHLYVEYSTGARELYDLRKDPHQLQNLLASGARGPAPEFAARLARRLSALRGCSGEDCRRAETADDSELTRTPGVRRSSQ